MTTTTKGSDVRDYYTIKMKSNDRKTQKAIDELNKIHNAFPYTMMKYAEEVMYQINHPKSTKGDKGKRTN